MPAKQQAWGGSEDGLCRHKHVQGRRLGALDRPLLELLPRGPCSIESLSLPGLPVPVGKMVGWRFLL